MIFSFFKKSIRTFIAVSILVLFSFSQANSQNSVTIDQGRFWIDNTLNLILVNQSIDEVNAQMGDGNLSEIVLDEPYELLESTVAAQVGVQYLVSKDGEIIFKLYFTELPVIHVTTKNIIVDEPRVNALFTLAEAGQPITEEFIGIEYRGGHSQSYPKKSFRVEFLVDTVSQEELDISLLGMRSDGDWNFQAMYNEPLRFNNMVSFKLWDRMDTLYYIKKEPEAINGVRMQYAELFLNNRYQGIYGVGERIDRKQLKLKKISGNSIRGELYKGKDWDPTVTFTGITPIDNNSEIWGGFKYEYPKPNEIINWQNLYNFVYFVVNSSNPTFYQNYHDYLVDDNFVNYFIFMNLIRATDNKGKNIFIAKYKADEPYFYVPWDLDGTFGVVWDGSNENITNDVLTNGLYNRLNTDCRTNGFVQKLQARWAFLRESGLISTETIGGWFDEHVAILERNGVYEREALAWADYSYPTEQMDFMKTWLEARIAFLDEYFTRDCEGYSSVDSLEIPQVGLYPIPTSGLLNVQTIGGGTYKISNLLGMQFSSGKLPTGNQYIDVSHLPSGVYIFTIEGGGAARFIKN